ncbi:MAG: TldD/PmbA family protein [Epulopiscium sp.]|nr:TldD/PmbA family protein [Candidatus Epulonipiscium sp.]
MTYRELANEIFKKGKNKMDAMEVYIEKSKQIQIGVFEGEIDKYQIAESEGLSLRGISGDKMGYSYTEKVDPSSIDMLVHEAYENAKYIDSVDKEIIFSGSEQYKEIEQHKDGLGQVSLEEKMQFVKKLEEAAFQLDERVVAVNSCIYNEIESSRRLINTTGIDLEDKGHLAYSYISVIVKEEDDTKTGMSYMIAHDFSAFDPKKMAEEAVEEGLSMLGATPIKSKEYPVIFRNDVFADLFGAYRSIFHAESVQKGLSLLKDKLGDIIASERLTVVDDPFLKGGFATRAFDDEGTATKLQKVIDQGVLNTYFYNWKTAIKDGVQSTGHGHRSSYKSPITTSTSNLYIEAGKPSFQSMIQGMDHGLLITNLAGLHAGLNPVSGDYSLSAHGYEVEDGKIKRPVNQITIAGNFFEMLMQIEEIGNDLKFNMSFIGSPSIKVKGVSVAGE